MPATKSEASAETSATCQGYPFGHGLSYTTFEYSNLRLEVTGAGQQSSVMVRADIRNTGARAGQEVVQVYVGDPKSSIDRPVRELKAFAKVSLEPGQSSEVVLVLTPRDLSYYSVELRRWVLEGGEFVIAVGSSSRDLRLAKSVHVEAALPAAAIGGDSSILEWLAHPKGGPILRNLMAQAPAQGDPDAMLRMIEGMPLNRLIPMSQGAMTQDMVDQMVAAANA